MGQNLISAASALPQVLVSQYIAASETTQYTGPAASAVKISTATICNVTANSVTVSVSLVKSGGTAGVSNRIVYLYPLAPNDTLVLNELVNHYLGPSDFISALAGTASAAVFVMSGVVYS